MIQKGRIQSLKATRRFSPKETRAKQAASAALALLLL